MRLLILGGSVFLGRALTDAALDKGHAVTHFRRGTSGAPDSRVETILGDRTGTLEALDARAFDAVADTSGYLPQDVRRSAEKLRDKAGRYLFVSSISAYAGTNFGEEGTLIAPPDPLPDAADAWPRGALSRILEASEA